MERLVAGVVQQKGRRPKRVSIKLSALEHDEAPSVNQE
jgi:hypothetical protein